MRPQFLLIFRLFFFVLILQPSLTQARELIIDLERPVYEVRKTALINAEMLKLAQHETWLALLHYKQEAVSRRVISQADDVAFFLHVDGKINAKAELITNIEAFFESAKKGHTQCLFPARWWWLKQQLNLSDEYDQRCPQLEAYLRRIDSDKLSLVFPTMYLNNPGSTFGHTFLRFDSDISSNLLSQTLNYAARVDKTDNVLTYIAKGVFGGYTGFFKMRSYYETVQEYNNIENRDIWEYRLAFSPEEIKQLVRHVWEIKDVDFDYFFFKENCAYRLLALLDVMRSGMELTANGMFPVYAIPVDTVRALKKEDLIVSRQFRASLATQIDDYFTAYKGLEGREEGQVTKRPQVARISEIIQSSLNDKDIKDVINTFDSDDEKIKALQQSYKILQFNNQADSKESKKILELTNQLKNKKTEVVTVIDDQYEVPLKEKISPEKGHESLRLSTGFGQQNDRSFIDLQFRAAFHDLVDAVQGYVDGAAINSFDFRFKGFVDDGQIDKIRFDRMTIINITSLTPIRSWTKPISWLVDFRLDRTQLNETTSVGNFIARGGVGFSFKVGQFVPYIVALAEANFSSHYAKGHSVLSGLQVGVLFDLASSRLLLSHQEDKAISAFNLDRGVSELQWQYNVDINHAMRLSYKLTEYNFFRDKDWSLNYNYYF